METDRELLELAARAAGYNVAWNEHWQGFQHRNPTPDQHGQVRHPWTPLTSDGDALRLATRLKLNIYHDSNLVDVHGPMNGQDVYATEKYGDDPSAATRRAIMRAAAEIGKAMP